MRKTVIFVFVTLLLLFSLTGCASKSSKATPFENNQAPDFELKDINGNPVRFSDYKGKTILLNFWSINCPYCLKELVELQTFFSEIPSNTVLITVNLDMEQEKVKTYLKEKGYTFPVLFDNRGEIIKKYLIRGIPLNILIDCNGIIKTRIEGALTKDYIIKMINSIEEGIKKPA